EWEMTRGVKFQVNGAVNYSNSQSKNYMLGGAVADKWDFQTMTIDQDNSSTPSILTQENDDALGLTFYSTLSYKKSFPEDHHFNLLIGTSSEWNRSRYLRGSATGFPGNNTWELDAGLGQPVVAGNSSGYTLQSYFGRLDYNFKERYLVEATLRDDGSSRFASGRRWGLFPSFSGAWRLSEEPFFKTAGLSVLGNVKFKASWGRLGNQNIGLYQFMDLYGIGQNYIFGSTVTSGIAPTSLSNPNITWETTTSANIGTELSFFNNQLDLEFDVFNNKTNNILVQLPLASAYGSLIAPYQNAGIVQNKGWELGGIYRNKAGAFRYSFNGNISHTANKVLRFDDNPNVIQSTGNNSIIKQGQSINALFGYQAAGIFQSRQDIDSWARQKPAGRNSPGDLRYRDQNGDGIIDDKDRVIIGSTIPRYYYGFGGDLSYRNIGLNVLFQGVCGVQRYYNNLWYTSAIRYRRAINEVFVNAWTPENTHTTVPRLTTDANTDNTAPSSYYVQNGSFLRLKNVQLSYTLRARWIKRSAISNLQIYANAQNLLTGTKFNGLDPETANPTDYQVEYPIVKIITFGLNATF
ncbi:MAG TPA: SusC/RagA family TonB-linked outer membrane protein, partial [Puia sp.]|nr:SusC/RagA family TonB-linked outer membrane protein [Puia sp.]